MLFIFNQDQLTFFGSTMWPQPPVMPNQNQNPKLNRLIRMDRYYTTPVALNENILLSVIEMSSPGLTTKGQSSCPFFSSNRRLMALIEFCCFVSRFFGKYQ